MIPAKLFLHKIIYVFYFVYFSQPSIQLGTKFIGKLVDLILTAEYTAGRAVITAAFIHSRTVFLYFVGIQTELHYYTCHCVFFTGIIEYYRFSFLIKRFALFSGKIITHRYRHHCKHILMIRYEVCSHKIYFFGIFRSIFRPFLKCLSYILFFLFLVKERI